MQRDLWSGKRASGYLRGEGLETLFACRWERVRLPRASGNSLDFPEFSELAEKFPSDFPSDFLV